MIVYAIKDKKTKKFYNRASRKLRPLAQNTAFYKTVKEAESEMSSRAGSKQILRKLLSLIIAITTREDLERLTNTLNSTNISKLTKMIMNWK